MKYLFVAFIIIILASYSVRAQAPTEIVPEFNFYKPDKTVFTKKDLAKGKYLFFIFFDSECDHCQQASLRTESKTDCGCGHAGCAAVAKPQPAGGRH